MVLPVLPDAEFLGILKNDGDGPSGAGRSSKPIPDVHHQVPYLVRQTRIAAHHSSGTRDSRGLTGTVGHSRAARCLWIAEFFFNMEFTLSCGSCVLLHRKIISSQLSNSVRLLTANSS